MNKIFLNNIGDLAEAQRSSFYRFLSRGISEELESLTNPFEAKIKVPTRAKKRAISCLVYLYTNELKLVAPSLPIESVLKLDLTYAIQIYALGEYSYKFKENLDKLIQIPNNKASKKEKNKIIKQIRIKEQVLLGEIPLMTEEGTFIINGCERVVVSQLIRSPGVYFKKDFGTGEKATYTATIISGKGSWTKIYLDKRLSQEKGSVGQEIGEDRIYIKLDEFRERSREEEKIDPDSDKLFLLDILRYLGLNFDEFCDSIENPRHLMDQIKYQRIPAENPEEIFETATSFFSTKDNSPFFLGEIGRYKANKRLGLNLPKNVTHLTALDFLRIIDNLIELKYSNLLSDDIDHMKNKQIRSVGELLQVQFRIGLLRLQKRIADGAPISATQIRSFLMEEAVGVGANSESFIIDPRPITTAIKEFFKTSPLSQYMDQINPLAELAHKRRVSVFGPNGLQRDHISTVIRDIHPSQYGRLCPVETPEGENAGLISSISMFGRVSSFGWIETPYFVTDTSILLSAKRPIYLNPQQESQTHVAFTNNCLNKKNLILGKEFSVKEDDSFLTKKKDSVNFLTTSPLQIVSLAASLIPFIEHDDANRALMGANMQRQAVPLLYRQKPIVGTGLETAAIADSAMVIKAYSEGIVLEANANFILIEDVSGQQVYYYLQKNSRSNQEILMGQSPIVWTGEKVFSGQIIADGPGTSDGELALGTNLTIAYMPWEGYNYEDAIVINEQVVLNDALTSLHIQYHETSLNYTASGEEQFSKNVPYAADSCTRKLDDAGFIKVGAYVQENDILVGKIAPYEEDTSPEGNLLKALFGEDVPTFRDVSLRVPSGCEGRVIDVCVIPKLLFSEDEMPAELREEEYIPVVHEVIRVSIAQIRKASVGDKLAGRHGNKGIISRIVPCQDMPYLPDGTPVDILFNPLGVPSRMNVGQIFECLLGLAGDKQGNRFKVSPFDEVYGKEASRVLVNQKLKEAAFKSNSGWIFNMHSPGKIPLRDGRTGEYFDNPITVGKSYILKLIHLVEDKIHARSIGPYSMITEQPLGGSAMQGGQRFGEMEVWAIEAYGCSNTLQELLTVKSDDIDSRNDMYEALVDGNESKKPSPGIPEGFLLLMRELNSLGLDFFAQKVTNGFYSPIATSAEERDLFSLLEMRLKLRTLLFRAETQIDSKKP